MRAVKAHDAPSLNPPPESPTIRQSERQAAGIHTASIRQRMRSEFGAGQLAQNSLSIIGATASSAILKAALK